jgi:predicted small lipoprotein YifL
MICILTVLAGCGKKAEPIDLPSNEAVTSIEVITIDGAKTDITETTQIETVMTALSAVKPTRVQSVNDQPANVDAYGTISINTAGEATVVYYYDKDSKHYIEQPYRGIYELEDNLEETLFQE